MLHLSWRDQLKELACWGEPIGPRGIGTKESLNWTLHLGDARWNILDEPQRKLNYRFMVAEWLWMMFGHSNVESIAQYNSIIRQFSDDGVWLTGAYGPHVRGQLPRVLSKLKADSTTRQAVIVMPRPMVETKDEPCTLSWHFMIRNGALNCVVNMRSSDIWLGVPYDVFSFTMLQNCIAGELHVPIGSFTLNCASSHLYDRDHEKAVEIYRHVSGGNTLQSPALPGMPPAWLDDLLVSRKKPEPTFEDHHLAWCMYADVLLAHGSTEALAILFETF